MMSAEQYAMLLFSILTETKQHRDEARPALAIPGRSVIAQLIRTHKKIHVP